MSVYSVSGACIGCGWAGGHASGCADSDVPYADTLHGTSRAADPKLSGKVPPAIRSWDQLSAAVGYGVCTGPRCGSKLRPIPDDFRLECPNCKRVFDAHGVHVAVLDRACYGCENDRNDLHRSDCPAANGINVSVGGEASAPMSCQTCGPRPWKTAPPLDSRDKNCPNCGRTDLVKA